MGLCIPEWESLISRDMTSIERDLIRALEGYNDSYVVNYFQDFIDNPGPWRGNSALDMINELRFNVATGEDAGQWVYKAGSELSSTDYDDVIELVLEFIEIDLEL